MNEITIKEPKPKIYFHFKQALFKFDAPVVQLT